MRRLFLFGLLGVGCYDVTILPATNLPPRTQGQVLDGVEDTDLTIPIAQLLEDAVDPEGDTELTLELVATATNGNAVQGAANITFTPDPDFVGVASFSYIVVDESGVESAPTTVNINVANTNDAPVALTTDDVTTNEDTPTTIILRATDIDSANLTFDILDNPPLERGELVLVQAQATSATFLYTPSPNEFGSDSFRFQVSDDSNPAFTSEIISVNININALNDAPVALADNNIAVTRGSSVLIDVLDNDSDQESFNSALTPEIFIAPLSGVATVENGQIRYSATDETLGPVIFFYRARDANAVSAPAQVTVTVLQTCGDGFVDTNDGEQCDELNGTGCEADCTFTCAQTLAPDATATNDDSCYATFRQGNLNFSADWNAAVSFCSQNGGQLVVVNDASENLLLRSAELSQSTDLIWIGATDQDAEDLNDGIPGDDFEWVDGTFTASPNFSDFAPGQPNNGNGTEHCLYLLESGEWDDTDCANPAVGGVVLVNSMICEFPLP